MHRRTTTPPRNLNSSGHSSVSSSSPNDVNDSEDNSNNIKMSSSSSSSSTSTTLVQTYLHRQYIKVISGFTSLSNSPPELWKAYILKCLDSYAYFSFSLGKKKRCTTCMLTCQNSRATQFAINEQHNKTDFCFFHYI